MLPSQIQWCCGVIWVSLSPKLTAKLQLMNQTADRIQQSPLMDSQAKPPGTDCFFSTIFYGYNEWFNYWQQNCGTWTKLYRQRQNSTVTTNGLTGQTTWNRLFLLHSMDTMNGLSCFPARSSDAVVSYGSHYHQNWQQNCSWWTKLQTEFNSHH